MKKTISFAILHFTVAFTKIFVKWINGELAVKINSLYEEYSKDLGSKKKESIVKIDLDSYDKIWNFEDYFKGTESFTNGEYARYWYSTKNTFLDCV